MDCCSSSNSADTVWISDAYVHTRLHTAYPTLFTSAYVTSQKKATQQLVWTLSQHTKGGEGRGGGGERGGEEGGEEREEEGREGEGGGRRGERREREGGGRRGGGEGR